MTTEEAIKNIAIVNVKLLMNWRNRSQKIRPRKKKMPKLPANVNKALTDAARALEKKSKKKKEEALVKKVGRALKMVFYGEKYHSKVMKRKLAGKPTVRTKDVTVGLRSAGLTQKEIDRLRGKK